MEWSKVKNIILFMLVITNLLLLFLVVVPRAKQQISQEEGLQSALTLLSQRGISVDSTLVPKSIHHLPQTVVPERSLEDSLASNLLGEVAMQNLGGGVLHYSTEAGVIRFHTGGEFTAQFESNAFPIGDIPSEEYSNQILESLQLDAVLTSITREDDGFSLTYDQLWEGTPLLDYGLTLHYQDNSLVQISDAKRLAGSPTVASSTQLTASTALMQFLAGLHQLGDICRTITAITPAYGTTTDLAGTVQLIPLWRIQTDTGAYQLNLLNGTLTRM